MTWPLMPRFCYEERVVVLADEVYQELTYRSDRWEASWLSSLMVAALHVICPCVSS